MIGSHYYFRFFRIMRSYPGTMEGWIPIAIGRNNAFLTRRAGNMDLNVKIHH
jgi:hypothetical protein